MLDPYRRWHPRRRRSRHGLQRWWFRRVWHMDGYDCVAVVVNQTFNSDGMLFEYTQSRHQPDYFCFQDIATRKKN